MERISYFETPERLQALKERAAKRGVSVDDLIREAITALLEKP